MVAVPDIVKRVIPFIAFAVEVIAGASCFYMYDKSNYGDANKVESGYAPKYYGVNASYYVLCSLFIYGLISLVMAVCELGLVIVPQYFKFVDSVILRVVIYVLTGIAILGTSADLGIAAASMQWIISLVMLIVYFLENGCKCNA